jgi:hypothetical protein
MAGCSLTEAFPDTTQESGRVARKEERKKAKACKGPALSFLQQEPDPDRQAERPPPAPEKMRTDGFADFKPIVLKKDENYDKGLVKELIGERVDDVIGKKGRVLPKATTASQLTDPTRTSYGEPVPSYFGKGDEDGFADFNKALNDNRGYTVDGSDFMKGFGGKGLDSATGGALPLPSLNDNWKPLSPSGVQSSFFNTYPSGEGNTQGRRGMDSSFSKDEKETLLKKLDTLFARLEELETKRNEYAHAEVTLFILSGLFLVFSLDSMRKFR